MSQQTSGRKMMSQEEITQLAKASAKMIYFLDVDLKGKEMD